MIEPSRVPPAPTKIRLKTADGRMVGTDRSVWAYRAVPLAPVVDAKSPADRLLAGEPLLAAYEEISAMTPVRMGRRSMSKGEYRETHALLVNIPLQYRPTAADPLAGYLKRNYRMRYTDRRLLMFGVRLRDRIGSGDLRATAENFAQSMLTGITPLSDFDDDYAKVSAALERAGLREPTVEDMRLADAWWNFGTTPDTPYLIHADHLHFFSSVEGMRLAERMGPQDCEKWDEEQIIPGEHAITFAAVRDLELPFRGVADPAVTWASHLVAGRSRVVSIRGLVEPSRVTRGELRRQRKRYIEDIQGRYEQGKMELAEQQEMLGLLEQIEGFYSGGDVPPTLTEASIVVGLDGRGMDLDQAVPAWSPAKLSLLGFRQEGALQETLMCSDIRANNYLMDLPTQAVAYSGLPGLSVVGDEDGALVGFTENDRQPARVSPTAAAVGDSLPLCVIPGATGSGKSMLGMDLSIEWATMGAPGIIIDPKLDSDFSEVVEAFGGQVISLDELTSADGVFDPLRFAGSQQVGIELAASMLMQINPWGSEIERARMEVPVQRAIAHGVERGATCTGQALLIARDELPDLPVELVSRVMDAAKSSALFRACVGVDPHTKPLRVADGLTLIKVGQTHLDLPEPGSPPEGLTQRTTVALIRMMVFGSAMALTRRDGFLLLDEAWTFLSGTGGRTAIERLGRLARSQRVLPVLLTQRVTDFVDAGLAGYISRGFILPLSDPTEALAACALFNLDPSDERIARITAKATIGSGTDIHGAPNWASMRALRDPSGRVLRGTIAIYVDLAGRAVPVEVVLPPEFLELASTNPDDVRRREARKVERLAQQQARRDALDAHDARHTDDEGDPFAAA
jgi:hypothetical protein